MSYNLNQKAIALRDEFASEFKVRLPLLAQTKNFSATDQKPTLLIGSGAAGADSVFMKIGETTTRFKDIIGQSQNVYTPNIAQLVIEANPAGGAGADVGTWATRLPILAAMACRGVQVELYVVANGTPPDETGIVAANLQSTFVVSAQYPLLANS